MQELEYPERKNHSNKKKEKIRRRNKENSDEKI